MAIHQFKPIHIHATTVDLAGNQGIGRYVLLPGSDGRAKDISACFNHLKIKSHPRGHHLYLGSISHHGQSIDVASIASGMGCASMEIILHELLQLGAKRFLRVGTSGSLQAEVHMGDLVCASAAVRDESTSSDYMPIEVPALADYAWQTSLARAAKNLHLSDRLHTGLVHCKSSFYAREFGAGPKASENAAYLDLLTKCGVLASEMETAALFTQSQLYDYYLRKQGQGPAYRVMAGAILAIISMPPHEFASESVAASAIESMIDLAFEGIRVMASEVEQIF